MASIVWCHTTPTATNRQRNCCRKSSVLPYRPEINLYAYYHAVHDESTIQSPRPFQIRPEQPTPSLQNCHAHSLKTNSQTCVQSFLTTLHGLQVKVTLIWIPGHSEIYYNDFADLWAKKGDTWCWRDPTSAVSLSVCKKMITKQCQSQWQTSWDRSEEHTSELQSR